MSIVISHFTGTRSKLLVIDMDMVTMYEDAYKQQPANEELGTQTFFANVRIGNWKAAQQVSRFMCFKSLRYEMNGIVVAHT